MLRYDWMQHNATAILRNREHEVERLIFEKFDHETQYILWKFKQNSSQAKVKTRFESPDI